MKRISARFLLSKTSEQLWNELTGRFVVVCDDGDLEVHAKDVLYSTFVWDYFHRRLPLTPILKRHFLVSVLKGKRMEMKTHLDLIKNTIWDAYDAYLDKPIPDTFNGDIIREMPEIQMRNRLAKLVYEATNALYNEMSQRTEEHVLDMSILDFTSIVHHPVIADANSKTTPTEVGIEITYNIIRDNLRTNADFKDNNLSKAYRSNLIKDGQAMQCLSHRGFLTDINSDRFAKPVMASYTTGIRRIDDSMMESRSASKALAFTKAPLQESEYFSRRLQLIALTLRNLHPGDCGSQKYLLFNVQGEKKEDGLVKRKSDLEFLDGKIYMDDDGQLKIIKSSDKHLEGRSLKLRSVIHCQHPDPYGICSVCYGELSKAVPYGTNVGHMNTSSMSQDASQNVMSTKHLDSNVQIEGITLYEDLRRFFKVGSNDHQYVLSDLMKGKKIKLIINSDDIPNITDIKTAEIVEMLNITRVSAIEAVTLDIEQKSSAGTTYGEEVTLEIKQKERNASMTYELLRYIREHGWTFDKNNNYVIDLAKWDYSQPIFALPMRHENMSDHAKAISMIVESNVKNKRQRDIEMTPDSALIDLFQLVNEKLSVNLAVLEIVLYTAMIVSAEENDFSIPKPWTTNRLGVASTTITGRSLAAVMAFEHHKDALMSPNSFLNTNVMDHDFDFLLLPREVEKAKGKPLGTT